MTIDTGRDICVGQIRALQMSRRTDCSGTDANRNLP